MNFQKLTAEKIRGKKILVRVDWNVPLKNGEILETSRILAAMKTLEFLRKNADEIHILTHIGRPGGKFVAEKSTKFLVPAAEKIWEKFGGEKIKINFCENLAAAKKFKNENLREFLKKEKIFDEKKIEKIADFCEKNNFKKEICEKFLRENFGIEKKIAENFKNEKIFLHENVRFFSGEKKFDENLAREIVEKTGAEFFVFDGFAVAHRAATSVVGPAKFLPAAAGFLLEKEIENLREFLTDEKISGFSVVISGAKLETKVPVVEKFCRTAENILLGGAIANTFLAAKNFKIGKSFFQKSEILTAQKILKLAEKFGTKIFLPIDAVAAENLDAPAEILEIEKFDKNPKLAIFDVGPRTAAKFCEILENSKIVILNGPVGVFEQKKFAAGTKKILEKLAQKNFIKKILGGGDTLEALKKFKIARENFTHISTGGGAMLEFLAGKNLPGIEIVRQ